MAFSTYHLTGAGPQIKARPQLHGNQKSSVLSEIGNKLRSQNVEDDQRRPLKPVNATNPTRKPSKGFAAEKQRCVSYTDIDSQERAAAKNTEQLDSSARAQKSQISSKFDHQEENSCLKNDTFTTKDEEYSCSLMQFRSKLDELTAENAAQKSEILTLNSVNEKLRNRMLSEIATLSQECSVDEVKSVDNVAIFDRFVKSIIHKEEEVIKVILEKSNNKLSAKENWISQLEKKVVSLEQELEESQKEKNDLRDKLLAQKETLTALEQDRLYLKKKLTIPESDMSYLQDENKDLTLRLRAAEDKITKLSENEKCVLLNLEKEKEQRTQLENELCKTKQKFEEFTNNVECSLRTDDTSDDCRCEELKNENKKLIQEAVARRCKIAQLQEEVANQANIIAKSDSELKEAQHKIRVYKLELKHLQQVPRTSYQVNQSRTYCDAATQAVDVNMYINYGCGIVTIGQILFWKSRAEQHLEQKKWLKSLCATLEKQINEMKKKPEALAIRNLAYTLHDEDILCIGRPKPPPGKENKFPYIDQQK